MGILFNEWSLDLLALVSLGAIGFYLYMTRNFNYWKKQGVKEVPPIFFFGNVAPCVFGKQNPYDLIKELYRKGEGVDMIGFYAFDKPYLILRDPELIKTISVRDFNKFTNKVMTGNHADTLGSNSIFLITSPPWKHLRQKLTPIFTSGKLKNMFQLMLEIIEDFHEFLENSEIDDKIGKPVDVKELCAKLMTDLIGTTAFGLRLNSLKNPKADFRSQGKSMFRSDYKRYLELLSIFFLPAMRPFLRPKFFDNEGSEFLKKNFWEVINERARTGIRRLDLIDLLIEIRKKQENDKSDEFKLEGDTLVAQAAIFFTGGFDTSSRTTMFGLYELGKRLDVQNRLRDEILKGIEENDGKVTYEMITTLPYLDMVVHEILRLHPVLGWLDRIADTDYVIPGKNVTLKKGTPVIFPMGSLHRDPQYFPDPEKFDPERFSEKSKGNIIPCTYFPFGEGPRNCIGARLGLIQVKLALVAFLSRYEVTLCKETMKKIQYEQINILTQVEGELYLNLRKISQ